MANQTKRQAEDAAGGLFLMALFTIMWIAIVEYNLQGRDHWLIGILFLFVVTIFGFYYFKFKAFAGTDGRIDRGDNKEDKKKGKGFVIVFIGEGLAIFIVLNVLSNIHHSNYFIASLAMIVGLHFFPLGIIFKRKFDFVIGAWTCIIAVAGMMMIYRSFLPFYEIIAFIGLGCVLATTAYGIKMIGAGNKMMRAYQDHLT